MIEFLCSNVHSKTKFKGNFTLKKHNKNTIKVIPLIKDINDKIKTVKIKNGTGNRIKYALVQTVIFMIYTYSTMFPFMLYCFFTILLLIYYDLNISYILRSCILYDFKYAAMQQPA